jgi:phosphopantothenoylcysteine decarboxylase/phosphopantothenate--cysteine ligase
MSLSASTPRDLDGRRILLYVSGSVAAYKAGDVVTLLRRRGAEVRVAMTEAATRFVGPVTLQSLSGHPVVTDLWESPDDGHGMEHLSLSAWAELQLCVAASADLLARLALGLADDAVTTTALACRAPLVIAPAMETAMWEHAATVEHIETLRRRGATFVGPVPGRLASGREGMGRMTEPADIVEAAAALL